LTGLYIHVPFCARACPYCDFDFEVGRQPDVESFFAGLQAEYDARELGDTAALRTVYIGGGTPTMLGPDGLARLLGWVDEHFDTTAAIEVTVEANPEHVTGELAAGLREARVDRVSLGVQTFDPAGLVQLGRAHRAEQAVAAARIVRAEGLRASVDLIVGWPRQSRAVLDADLDRVIDTSVEHVSIYALTVESGTPWERLIARGTRSSPDPDQQAEALSRCERRLTSAGFEHYEVASYARDSARAEHNTSYWTWRDYVGLGPSAASASYDDGGAVTRRTNPRGLGAWSSDPQAAVVETLGPVDAAVEGLWTGLRLLQGLDVAAFLGRFGAVDRAWLHGRCDGEVARGNLRWGPDADRLSVAPDRWLLHDEICAALM
jgi:oxygen-independent coproporphyrinogen-3 oxidase